MIPQIYFPNLVFGEDEGFIKWVGSHALDYNIENRESLQTSLCFN